MRCLCAPTLRQQRHCQHFLPTVQSSRVVLVTNLATRHSATRQTTLDISGVRVVVNILLSCAAWENVHPGSESSGGVGCRPQPTPSHVLALHSFKVLGVNGMRRGCTRWPLRRAQPCRLMAGAPPRGREVSILNPCHRIGTVSTTTGGGSHTTRPPAPRIMEEVRLGNEAHGRPTVRAQTLHGHGGQPVRAHLRACLYTCYCQCMYSLLHEIDVEKEASPLPAMFLSRTRSIEKPVPIYIGPG
jgi:hypothetical protein